MKKKILIWGLVVIIALLIIYFFLIPLLFCTRIETIINNPKYSSCFQDSDCTASECGCLNENWFVKIITSLCGPYMGCIVPTSCTCENNKCQNHYDYSDGEVMTDEEAIENVYLSYLSAGEKCDIPLTESIVTERTKEIVHYTCSNMANEVKCYIGRDYEVKVKNNTAVVYLTPFSHKIENPFFFTKENGEWKVDLYKMAMGLVMIGSTCDSGWGWRSQELADEFCSYFEPGECPDD